MEKFPVHTSINDVSHVKPHSTYYMVKCACYAC